MVNAEHLAWERVLWVSRRHGVITRDELRRLGVSGPRIDRAVTARRLFVVHRGVYAVGRPELTREGRYLAAVRAVGRGAVLSHRAAGVLWALLPGPGWGDGRVDVSVTRRPRARERIRLHCLRTLAAEEVTDRDGIPVTTASRTLRDLAGVLPDRALRRAVNEALVRRLVTEGELWRGTADARGARSTARLRALLATAAPTRSELEDRFLALLDAHGLPRPDTNVLVAGLEVDAYFPGAGLVVELDGAAYHGSALARRRDAERDAILAEHGLSVLRLGWGDVVQEDAATVARLRSLLPR